MCGSVSLYVEWVRMSVCEEDLELSCTQLCWQEFSHEGLPQPEVCAIVPCLFNHSQYNRGAAGDLQDVP